MPDGTWNTDVTTYANPSGYEVIELTAAPNATTSNRVQIITWKGSSSTKEIEMTFTQQAAPLALQAPETTTAGNAYTLRRDVTGTGKDYGFFCKGYSETVAECYKIMADISNGAATGDPKVQVWRNGTLLTWKKSSTTPPLGATGFTFTDAGILTLGEPAQAGDVIKVTLKTGDAPEETISWTVTAPAP